MLSNSSDFKFNNHPSILEYSKIIISEGLKPHRVVLRQLDDLEYVTHMENVALDGDTWKHGDFYWGHYFSNKSQALADFSERARKL